jgi:hypothetical protein
MGSTTISSSGTSGCAQVIGISRTPWVGAVAVASLAIEQEDGKQEQVCKDKGLSSSLSIIETNLKRGLTKLKRLIINDGQKTFIESSTTSSSSSLISYIVNPTGDLPRTEETIVSIINDASKQLLSSSSSSKSQRVNGMIHSDCAKADAKKDAVHLIRSTEGLFLFSGHGAGETLLPRECIPPALLGSSPNGFAPLTMLMGCSSGRMMPQKFIPSQNATSSSSSSSSSSNNTVIPTKTSLLHPHSYSGVSECSAVSYLYGGSPCVTACLWDVTDKDIDRVTGAILLRAVGDSSAASSSSIQKATTMKMPSDDDKQMVIGRGLAASVTALRSSCKLPYLTGAALVVYGMPI